MSECKTCKVALGARNKTGYCRNCYNGSPEKRARLSETVKRNWATNPELRQRYIEAGTRNLSAPLAKAKALATVRKNRTWEVATKSITQEDRMKAARRGTETKLAHIPREMREEYRHLTRTKRYLAADAARIVLEQHARDMEKFRTKIGAHEVEREIEAREARRSRRSGAYYRSRAARSKGVLHEPTEHVGTDSERAD